MIDDGGLTVTATYSRPLGGLAGTLTLGYSTESVTHYGMENVVSDAITAAAGNVLADDTLATEFTSFLVQDENGDFVEVTNGMTVVGAYGTLTLNADGSYTYTPTADIGAIGNTDVFTYRLVHPSGRIADANLEVSIAHGEGPYDDFDFSQLAVRSFFEDDVVPVARLAALDELEDPSDADDYTGADSIGFTLPDGEAEDEDISFDGVFGGGNNGYPSGGANEATNVPDAVSVTDPLGYLHTWLDDDISQSGQPV